MASAADVHFYTSSTSPHHVDNLLRRYPSPPKITTTTTTTPTTATTTNKTSADLLSAPGLLRRALDRLRLHYYRYEVTYGAYVMSPGEKLVMNSFIVVALALLVWALLVYFPSLLIHKISRLDWLLTGREQGWELGLELGLGVWDGSECVVRLRRRRLAHRYRHSCRVVNGLMR